MFMICILFSTDSEQIGYMWGVSKHIPRIQKFYQAGAALPGFEIPGSTPVYIISFMILCSFSSLAASVTSKYRDWQTDEQTQRLPHRESQDDGSFGLLPTANVF